jgi:hypothetical protein
MIPEDVLKKIISRAEMEYPGDKEKQEGLIAEEKRAYLKLHSLDFSGLKRSKEDFIKSAQESCLGILDSWDFIYGLIENELTAYQEYEAFAVDGIQNELVDEWKKRAKEERGNHYAQRLDFLKEKAQKHAKDLAIRQQIDPIKGLLIELGNIIGKECYSGYTQNDKIGGLFDSCRKHPYYPTFYSAESGEKINHLITTEIPSEELIEGRYLFGSHRLYIYRALFKVVMHLREKYDLKV